MKKFLSGSHREKSGTMKKGVLALLLATLAGALTFGAAASLSISANDLGSGTAVVEACDTDGITVDWTQTQEWMTEVDLVGVDNRCDGQALTFLVDGALGVAENSVVVPIDASTTVTVPIALGINTEAINFVRVTIAGANLTP